jgi:gamma-glutamyltranspeptidase/glutathione hydrolase
MTDPRGWVPVPLARGRHGAVVAPHHVATAAGLRVLQAGGSAVDAAIATNAVLGLVMPDACGIGGDAFWLVWDAAARTQVGLNGSGRAAAALDADAVLAAGHRVLPDRGPLTITVPGAVRSWAAAHERWGRLDRKAVLRPAIDLARDGFPADERYADAVEAGAAMVADELGGEARAAFATVFQPRGRAPTPGELVRRPELADTLETLARDGFGALYEGPVSERLVRTLAAAGSPLTHDDFDRQATTWTVPIATTYRGIRLTTHPPNSSGVVALQILRVLERFEPPPPAAFGPAGVTDARWIHLGIEAAKLAMADRDALLGNPDDASGTAAVLDELLDDARIAQLAGRIDPARAAQPPASTMAPAGDTIHLAVVDAEGNAVSLIQSNYFGFGSGIVDAATGVVFHNRGSYFSLERGHPNELAPGKRPLHTLLPAMLFRDDEPGPWIVVGSMGGDAQPQIHAQFVSAVVDGGLDIATAVSAPRWFVAPETRFAPPITVEAEPRFGPGVIEALRALGHPVAVVEPFDSDLGHEHAIELVHGGPASPDGSVAATTDPRSAGLPAVW